MFKKICSPLHFRVVDDYNGGSNGIQLIKHRARGYVFNCSSTPPFFFYSSTNMSHPLFTMAIQLWKGGSILFNQP